MRCCAIYCGLVSSIDIVYNRSHLSSLLIEMGCVKLWSCYTRSVRPLVDKLCIFSGKLGREMGGCGWGEGKEARGLGKLEIAPHLAMGGALWSDLVSQSWTSADLLYTVHIESIMCCIQYILNLLCVVYSTYWIYYVLYTVHIESIMCCIQYILNLLCVIPMSVNFCNSFFWPAIWKWR
jgi:hypothetical protein